jgi:TetR/AcrR family transcriptional regulator, mexJK operon transcriptional repressor
MTEQAAVARAEVARAEVVRGRRLEARRRAFLEAATAVFLEKGYANSTLDDVIARSGGSRQTLYTLFGGKQGLFEVIVSDYSSKIFGTLNVEDMLGQTPDQVLVELGIRYLQTVTSPVAVGLFRLLIAESISMPHMAKRFWEIGPNHDRTLLSSYFAHQARRGILQLTDPERAAQQFWGMLRGDYHIQGALCLCGPPTIEEVFVKSAISRFLDGCRAGTHSDGP